MLDKMLWLESVKKSCGKQCKIFTSVASLAAVLATQSLAGDGIPTFEKEPNHKPKTNRGSGTSKREKPSAKPEDPMKPQFVLPELSNEKISSCDSIRTFLQKKEKQIEVRALVNKVTDDGENLDLNSPPSDIKTQRFIKCDIFSNEPDQDLRSSAGNPSEESVDSNKNLYYAKFVFLKDPSTGTSTWVPMEIGGRIFPYSPGRGEIESVDIGKALLEIFAKGEKNAEVKQALLNLLQKKKGSHRPARFTLTRRIIESVSAEEGPTSDGWEFMVKWTEIDPTTPLNGKKRDLLSSKEDKGVFSSTGIDLVRIYTDHTKRDISVSDKTFAETLPSRMLGRHKSDHFETRTLIFNRTLQLKTESKTYVADDFDSEEHSSDKMGLSVLSVPTGNPKVPFADLSILFENEAMDSSRSDHNLANDYQITTRSCLAPSSGAKELANYCGPWLFATTIPIRGLTAENIKDAAGELKLLNIPFIDNSVKADYQNDLILDLALLKKFDEVARAQNPAEGVKNIRILLLKAKGLLLKPKVLSESDRHVLEDDIYNAYGIQQRSGGN